MGDLQWLKVALLPMAGHGMLNQRASAWEVGTQLQGFSGSQNGLALIPGKQNIDLTLDKRDHPNLGNAAVQVYI